MESGCTLLHQVAFFITRVQLHSYCITLFAGYRACEFRNRDQIRRNLLLASRGLQIRATLPFGFPATGPDAAISWAFENRPGYPPNIVLFVAALLGLK